MGAGSIFRKISINTVLFIGFNMKIVLNNWITLKKNIINELFNVEAVLSNWTFKNIIINEGFNIKIVLINWITLKKLKHNQRGN